MFIFTITSAFGSTEAKLFAAITTDYKASVTTLPEIVSEVTTAYYDVKNCV